MKQAHLTDEEREEAFREMQSELRTGECARIDSPANGPDRVSYCGESLGVIDADRYDAIQRTGGADGFGKAPEGIFRSTRHALRAIQQAANAAKYYPNVYHVNERGNVSQLHPTTGRELASWV